MKLSIITINWNNAEGLKKTIESVVLQKNLDFEYIIIDGESTDGSIEIIKQYENSITYWKSEPDSGIYNAMNKGIKQAQGDYCLFLNSGDFLVNSHILEDVFTQNYSEDFLIGNCNVSQNRKIIHVVQPTKEITLQNFYRTTLPHQATFIKKSLFDKFGLYDEKYKIHGDYEFWIRTIILNNCTTKSINHIISDYNLEGLSSNNDNKELSKNETDYILFNHFPKKVLKDYENCYIERQELQVLLWYKNQVYLNKLLILIYKIFKNIRKLLNLNPLNGN